MRTLISILFLGLFSSQVCAALPEFQSGPEQVSLLELYSSEGCSSCPPADQWFSTLQSQPDLWKRFVPVAFHVTYWDRLGWKDHLAAPLFDERQKALVESWKGWTYATPTFVWNGEELKDVDGFAALLQQPTAESGVLKVKALDESEFLIFYIPTLASSTEQTLEAHGALLGFDIHSEIVAGENKGKKLTHHFAVLSYRRKDLTFGNHQGSTSLTLKVSNPNIHAVHYGVAFWISMKNDPRPIQVVGGYLPLPALEKS